MDRASTPRPTPALESPSSAVFTFVRRVGAATLFDFAVERSRDLANWVPVVDGVLGASVLSTPLDEIHETMTVHAPFDAPRLFLRLRATSL